MNDVTKSGGSRRPNSPAHTLCRKTGGIISDMPAWLHIYITIPFPCLLQRGPPGTCVSLDHSKQMILDHIFQEKGTESKSRRYISGSRIVAKKQFWFFDQLFFPDSHQFSPPRLIDFNLNQNTRWIDIVETPHTNRLWPLESSNSVSQLCFAFCCLGVTRLPLVIFHPRHSSISTGGHLEVTCLLPPVNISLSTWHFHSTRS